MKNIPDRQVTVKYIRDGHVAVLYSPGYGAGWSSWNLEYPVEELLFDRGLVELVLDESTSEKQLCDYAKTKWGNEIYTGGVETLQIAWIPEGMEFRIHEYDGAENIVFKHDYIWIEA